MQINPNIPSGIRPNGSRPNASGRARAADIGQSERAEVNFIPSDESLASKVRSAIAALKQGIFFDRGSILNLLV